MILEHIKKLTMYSTQSTKDHLSELEQPISKNETTTIAVPKSNNPSSDVLYITLNRHSYILDFVPPTLEWRKTNATLFNIPYNKSISASPMREISLHYFPTDPKCIVTMAGDGNCLFRALAYCVTGQTSHTDHINVRKTISDYLYSNANNPKIRGMVRMDVIEYLQKNGCGIARPASSKEQCHRYGTDVEIQVFAEMTNSLIYVWNPSFYLSKNLRPTWKCFGFKNFEKPTFFLQYIGSHFNVVLM